MKHLFTLITAVVLSIFIMPVCITDAYSEDTPDISAKAAVLISADTGEIIYDRNCNKKLPMASTTKIMTTLLCIESGDLDEEFVVDSEAIKVEGSSMGLREGDIVTKYALCCGMLLPSGNDAANAAAVKIAGSIDAFADMMNERACKMGLSRTFFVTPSGLEGEGHGSSAYDMALLAAEALKNDIFRSICSQSTIQVEFGKPPYKRTLKNTNKLLTMCEGVYGVKTGFTDEAGRCLVSACERNGKKLICVTLNDRNDWQDHSALYDYGFKKIKQCEIPMPSSFTFDLAGGENDVITASADISKLPVASLSKDTAGFELTTISSPFIYAPVKKGDELAQLKICFYGREVTRLPLYACEDAAVKKRTPEPEKKQGLLDKIKNFFRKG